MKPQLEQIIEQTVLDLWGIATKIELSRPEEEYGDYATNIALVLSKQLKQPPRELANELADKLRSDQSDVLVDISVAGPGFLNLLVSDHALAEAAASQVPPEQSGEIVIETNNPNPFKVMHIGHAFNAVVADTVANLLEVGGRQAHRVSYHGDVGTHVGKSMWSLLRYIDGDVSRLIEIPERQRNSFMSRMYAEGTKAYAQDEAARSEIDALAKQSFQLDDPLFKQVYQTCTAWSFAQIDALVMRLGNRSIEKRYLESQADALGVETVRAHVPDVFQENAGALVFPGSQYGSFDNIFVSSHGRGLYGARDLGLMQLKHEDYPNALASYIVTAEEQRDYFKGVIAAAEQCLPELAGVTKNIATGTVKLSTGKMSSRSGDVLEIEWLFEQIAAAVAARGGAPDDSIVAGALRYQFLKVRIGSDVVFDVAEAVSLQGNSGPYLQYAQVRARSIVRKAALEDKSDENLPAGLLDAAVVIAGLQSDERSLVRKMSEYTEIVERSVTELLPHNLCSYLYELAQQFNRFYEHNRVVGDERQTLRLAIVSRYADILEAGLHLLGIASPEKM